MHGGMVSAITAEAASKATAPPGFCRDRRAAGISTEPTAATSAIFEPEMPEKITIDSTITTFSPPRSPSDQAFEQRDQANGHAVRLHQIADQNEKWDREQHEIVDAARHLLSENEAGKRAFDPDVNQRGERERKSDRNSADETPDESQEHQAGRARCAHPMKRQPYAAPASARAMIAATAMSDSFRRQNWPARISSCRARLRPSDKMSIPAASRAGRLPGCELSQRNRVPRHRSGGRQDNQRRNGVDAPAGLPLASRRRMRRWRSHCAQARPPRRRSSSPP